MSSDVTSFILQIFIHGKLTFNEIDLERQNFLQTIDANHRMHLHMAIITILLYPFFVYYTLCTCVQARHIYICDYHKQVIQCARTKQQQQRRRKDSEEDSGETDNDLPEVDLFQLQVGTLRRYKRHYKVSTRPGLNKAQLADVSTVTLLLSYLVSATNKIYICVCM